MSENHPSAASGGTEPTPTKGPNANRNHANQSSTKSPETEQIQSSQNVTQIKKTPVKVGPASGTSALTTESTPTRSYKVNFVESKMHSATKRKARSDSSELDMSDSESQAEVLKKKIKKDKKKRRRERNRALKNSNASASESEGMDISTATPANTGSKETNKSPENSPVIQVVSDDEETIMSNLEKENIRRKRNSQIRLNIEKKAEEAESSKILEEKEKIANKHNAYSRAWTKISKIKPASKPVYRAVVELGRTAEEREWAEFPVMIEGTDKDNTLKRVFPKQRALEGAGLRGCVRSIRDINNNKWLISLTCKAAQNYAAQIKTLRTNDTDVPVRTWIPGEHTSGVIEGIPTWIPTDDIAQSLMSGNKHVTEVKRLNGREGRPTQCIKITFGVAPLPRKVNLDGGVYGVTPFTAPMARCFNCQGWGHGAWQCKLQAKCAWCGDNAHAPHEKGKKVICPNRKKKCANCGGNHPAFASNGCRKAEDHKLAQMVAAVHAIPLYTVLSKIHNTVQYKDGRVWNDPWAYRKEDFIKREIRQAPLPTTKSNTDQNKPKNPSSVWDSGMAGLSTQTENQNKKSDTPANEVEKTIITQVSNQVPSEVKPAHNDKDKEQMPPPPTPAPQREKTNNQTDRLNIKKKPNQEGLTDASGILERLNKLEGMRDHLDFLGRENRSLAARVNNIGTEVLEKIKKERNEKINEAIQGLKKAKFVSNDERAVAGVLSACLTGIQKGDPKSMIIAIANSMGVDAEAVISGNRKILEAAGSVCLDLGFKENSPK